MYDKEQSFQSLSPTASCLIGALQKVHPDAKVMVCGDDNCFIHVEKDNSVVNIDNEPLDECYEDNGNAT